MNTKSLVSVVFFTALASQLSFAQENMITLGDYQYAQFDGTWYTVVDSLKGDLVDTRHLVVRLKDGEDISAFDFTVGQLPVLRNVRGRFAGSFYELEVPLDLDPFKVAKVLQATGSFDNVFFNVFVRVNDEWPNDEHYSGQWNLPKISMPQGWSYTTGDPAVIVAVIDVGADYNHEDLQANLWSGIGYDFRDNDSDPYPDDGAGHGTAVAGILGAVTHNVIGVAGVGGGSGGTYGIRIMHLDAGWLDPVYGELIDVAAAAQATDSASSWGAKVINMSFGGLDELPALEAAINLAVASYGVVVVAAAGNYRENQPTDVMYPAAYSNVIAVGATTSSDTRKQLNDGTEDWWGSSYGPELDVMAPGIYIWTTDITGSNGYSGGNYYDSFNGTSSAAPHTAGLAGLIRSVNSSLTWDKVRETIRVTADKVPGMGGADFHNEYGYGRLNALYAVAPPATPTGLTLTNSGGHPKLDWNANLERDMDFYKIYRKADGVHNWQSAGTVNHPTTTWTDMAVQIPGLTYVYYKIKAVDIANLYSPYSAVKSTRGQVIQKALAEIEVPKEFSLWDNFPNPFNPVTTIMYDLPENSSVTLKVYDLMGHEIKTLANGNAEAGYQNVIWDGKDSHGNPVSSGMYLYRLDAISRESDKEFHMARKMVLLR